MSLSGPSGRPHPVVAIVALVLTACAGDGDGAANTTTARATAVSATPSTTPAPGTGSSTAPAATSAAPTTGPPTTAAPTTAPPTTTPPTTAPPATQPLGDPVVSFTEVATLEATVDLAWREGDTGRYVVEQAGRVTRIDESGGTEVVLDLTDLTEAQGEQGLLGLAFAPAGDLAYVNYIDGDGDTVIGELAVADDGTIDAGSLRSVYAAEQPYANHNGGDLTFGPDGFLYIALGDGGSGGDPERRATDLSTPLGKMLRIDPAPSGDQSFTVPGDNPFVGTDGALGEIWSSGLRNPWKFAFDAETGDLWIADVGQNEYEEIDIAPASDGVNAGRGLSFGWSAFEGEVRFNEDVPAEGHTPPVFTYSHDAGCSISGGDLYRGEAIPELVGWYVYGDLCAGTVWALEVNGEGDALAGSRVVELGNVGGLTAIVAGPDRELHALSTGGAVLRLERG